MWLKYLGFVSFGSMIVSYVSILLVGWSWAKYMPFLSETEQKYVLVVSGALAIVFLPLWYLHWRLARRDWSWDSKMVQNYLLFFTSFGLIATVVVGLQLLIRVLQITVAPDTLAADEKTFAANQQFLTGAGWSTAWSLWLWMHHGRVWLFSRRDARQSGMA